MPRALVAYMPTRHNRPVVYVAVVFDAVLVEPKSMLVAEYPRDSYLYTKRRHYGQFLDDTVYPSRHEAGIVVQLELSIDHLVLFFLSLQVVP